MILRCCVIAGSRCLSAVLMTSFILEATPQRLPRSLTWCVASLTAHMLHVNLLREDGFCDVVRLQDRGTFELYA